MWEIMESFAIEFKNFLKLVRRKNAKGEAKRS